MSVRPATLADASAIASVHVGSSQTTYRSILPDEILREFSHERQREHWAKVLGDATNQEFVFVAENDVGQVVGLESGFAAGRNRKSEEERSHSGLQEREKKVFLHKNLFRNRESRTVEPAELADQKGRREMRGEKGTLRCVRPAQNPEKGWMRSF